MKNGKSRAYAFWDTSALVALLVPGQGTRLLYQTFRETAPVIWWGTPVEARSAIERLSRSGALTAAAYRTASGQLDRFLATSLEVAPTDEVRDLAMVQLANYPLRAADALQLAAALHWCRARPKDRLFVSNDRALSTVARHAGFDVRSM
jgi:predicted nucleic acid-binding protein